MGSVHRKWVSDAPLSGVRVEDILREATRVFDAPVALLPLAESGRGGLVHRAIASARVTSAAGVHLATLCILGAPGRDPPDAAILTRLRELADDTAAAIANAGD